MANPGVMEKGAEFVGSLVDGLSTLAKRAATNSGNAAPMAAQQQAAQIPTGAAGTPQPPANGSTQAGGWPQL